MSSRGARVARGFAAASVATVVAALFHVLAGGDEPSALALTLSVVFSTLGSIALVGRRLAVWRLTLAVLVSQFFFHALFTLSPSASFSGLPADGHLHAGMRLTMVPGAMTGGGMPGMTTGADPWMWASHAAAALLTIVALLHGERTLLALGRFVSFALRRLIGQVTVPPEPLRRLRAALLRASRSPRLCRVVLAGTPRRGPPGGFVPVG